MRSFTKKIILKFENYYLMKGISFKNAYLSTSPSKNILTAIACKGGHSVPISLIIDGFSGLNDLISSEMYLDTIISQV